MITKVTILGREYPIVYEDLSGENLWGEHCQDELIIRVHNDLTEDQTRTTILHEALHAIFHESGLNRSLTRKLEESICRAIEHGLFRSGLLKERFEDGNAKAVDRPANQDN